MAWAVRGRSSSVFGPSVWRGSQRRKSLALTFDDGPSPATPALLEILAEYRVPATFFQIGSSVAARPEIARAVRDAGHEIGNHSHTHPNFALTRPSFIADEFRRAQDAIARATGVTPSLLRAPFGVRWFGFRRMQRQLNLKGVMWTVIGRDWRLSADAIARRVINRTRGGDIVCLHDGRGTLEDPDIRPTLEAVRRILPNLLEKGYHFETVSQLLCPMKPPLT
ncbi:MAG: polysaccharide deacetylase family protein [Acidobacteriota bacterium]|nr:polysaccharide deacetylase family protein [Acidobacteriota bacterium]